ncbi:MAG: hypothetical protein KIS63_23855, partial [Caldilineales bacterium]|nr:hypothetical protein [Caldilineales bacterium]
PILSDHNRSNSGGSTSATLARARVIANGVRHVFAGRSEAIPPTEENADFVVAVCELPAWGTLRLRSGQAPRWLLEVRERLIDPLGKTKMGVNCSGDIGAEKSGADAAGSPT